jgi:dienelactone hydrolase
LFLTSGTGLRSVNNQLQADKYAAEGFLVIMPDLFDNDPAPNSTEPVEEGQLTLLERIKMRAVETAKSFLIDMWLARHTPAKVLPILRKTIEAAKDEFADAISSGGGIYSVGYSVGAKYTLHLASEDAFAGLEEAKADADEEAGSNERGPCIKAGAIAHGTLVTEDDFGRIKSPILMICVENDQLFPDSVRRAGEGLMLKRGVDHEVEIYPDAPHGKLILSLPFFLQHLLNDDRVCCFW